MIMLVQLRDEVTGLYDRSGNQLREEAYVETEVKNVLYWLDLLAIHIH